MHQKTRTYHQCRYGFVPKIKVPNHPQSLINFAGTNLIIQCYLCTGSTKKNRNILKYIKVINMHSIETKYGEMDFHIDQEGKLYIYLIEEKIREQYQLENGSEDKLIRSEYW